VALLARSLPQLLGSLKIRWPSNNRSRTPTPTRYRPYCRSFKWLPYCHVPLWQPMAITPNVLALSFELNESKNGGVPPSGVESADRRRKQGRLILNFESDKDQKWQ